MYLSFYNLKVKPFQMGTDPNFLWLGEKHKEALATLEYAILENKGILALTGDVGTGKTTLINALVERLGKDTLAATIYNPKLEVNDFFNVVGAAFKLEDTFEGKGKFILRFMEFLIKAHERNQKVLLIIDEAQGISSELLEEIRLLSNLEAEYTRLLNIFFVGQNEFDDILREYKNRALRQRVTIRYHIEPLTPAETEAYIRHRLDVSGAQWSIFDPGAIKEIFSFSNGYPRLINIICDHALLSGYVREVRVITADVIKECRQELEISSMIPEKDSKYSEDDKVAFELVSPLGDPESDIKRIKRSIVPMAVLILFLAGIGIFSGYVFYDHGGNKKAGLPFTSIKQNETKFFSVNGESEKNKQPTVPSRSEIPKNFSPVEAKKASAPDVSLGESVEKESPRDMIQAPKKPIDETASSPTPKKPPEKIQATGSIPAEISSDLKTFDTQKKNSFKHVDIPETAKSVIKPGQVEKKAAEEFPAKPILQKKEPVSPRGPSMEEASSPTEAPVEKKSTALIAKPLVSLPELTVVSKTEPQVENEIASKEMEQPPVPPPEEASSQAEAPVEKKSTALIAKPLVSLPEQTVASKMEPQVENEIVSKEKEQPPIPPTEVNILGKREDGNVVSSVGKTSALETDRQIVSTNINLKARLDAFLTDYCRTYAKKDLDRFIDFFAANAVEKGIPFRSRLPQYRRNFNKIDSIEYDITLERYAIQEETGLVEIGGTFHVRAQLSGNKEWLKNSGWISMMLEPDGNSFKVIELDYE